MGLLPRTTTISHQPPPPPSNPHPPASGSNTKSEGIDDYEMQYGPSKYHFNGYEFTRKNKKIKSVSYICSHDRTGTEKCTCTLHFPRVNGLFVNTPTVKGLHLRRCTKMNGLKTDDPDVVFIRKKMTIDIDSINMESESPSKKLKPAEVIPRDYVDTKFDMKILTKELSIKNLPALPDAIWMEVKREMDTKFGETGWSGLRKEQV